MSIKVTNNFSPENVLTKTKLAISLYGNTAAQMMETDAKRNKKWQNRTGNAVNSIQGKFHWRAGQAVITLSGNVNYFVFLELANEKKYSILKPTIDKWTPEVVRGYERMLK